MPSRLERRPSRTLWLTLAMLLAAACISVFLVSKLQPASAGAFAFLAAWLVLPYAVLGALLIAFQHWGKPLLPWCVAAVLVALGGLLMIVDAIYWHPDPQSAIGVVLTPAYQGIAFLIGVPLAWWAAKRTPA